MTNVIVKLMLIFSVAYAFTANATQDVETHVEIQGIDLALQLASSQKEETTDSIEDQSLRAIIKFKEKLTGKAISQLRPKAWLSLRRSEQVATETSCEAKVRSFSSGQLTARADVDLNSYLLLTLNQDKTVTFINPQVAWSRSKLESIVVLPEQGLDWVLTKDGKWLYVTMPDASAVAVIDTIAHKVVSTLSTGKGTKPTRIALTPDQQSVWVGLDGSASVAVLSRGDKPELKLLEAAKGLHQISFTQDGKQALVTNTAANSVSLFDVATHKKLGDIAVSNTPLKAAWVEKAGLFYVASINSTDLSVIDPLKLAVVSKIDVGQGAVDVAVDPQGRFVWVVNQLASKVVVIDSATNTKLATAQVATEPDQIVFTTGYAYIRGLASEKFSLIEIGQVAKLSEKTNAATANTLHELAVTQIQAGEKPPSTETQAIGVAPMIVPIPEQNGAMIASAPGKSIYYYTEGMMVPMGTLDNYQRIPRGLMVLDRSLRETSPGVFEAPVVIEKSGNYDVAVMLDQPRIIHCFTTKLSVNAEKPTKNVTPKLKLELLPLPATVTAGVATTIRFQLQDAATGQLQSGIRDARLLAFEPPGLWQQRFWLTEESEGVYQAIITFPHTGRFKLLVEALSKGLAFTDQPLSTLSVAKPP
ncbi:MAG: YncE family protein [Methylococcales bacterium]